MSGRTGVPAGTLRCLAEKDGAVTLKVKVQPRASRNELSGVQGDCLKVKISSPPVEGMANEKLCEFLAGLMGIGKQRVQVIAGHTGRVKRVRIDGVSVDEVSSKLIDSC